MESLTNMLEALVITLREGIEASLVVGIVLSFLARSGRSDLKRPVWIGVGFAIIGSMIGAALFRTFGIDPENEILQGSMFFTAAVMVGTLVIWMWRQGKSRKADIEDKLQNLVGNHRQGLLGTGIGLFAFVFFMVLREGIETVLFLLALNGNVVSSPANNVIGGGIGIILAAGFGFLLFKGSLRINLKTFFTITSFVLMGMVLKLIGGGIHEFTEIQIFPRNDTWMNFIGWLNKDSTTVYILMALIGLPALMILKEALKIKPEKGVAKTLTDGGSESLAERRKRMAHAGSARRWGISTGIFGVAVVLAMGLTQAAVAAKQYDPDPSPAAVSDDTIVISKAELGDHEIHKYTYSSDQGKIRILVIFDGDAYHSVFDACIICPARGFMQEGANKLICKNCNAPLDMETIDVGGGCNPMPLEIQDDGGSNVKVNLSDLMNPDAMAKFD